MKSRAKKIGNKVINEVVWEGFATARSKKHAYIRSNTSKDLAVVKSFTNNQFKVSVQLKKI